MSEQLTTSGVIYYEAAVLETGGIPQLGFATSGFARGDAAPCGEGVGDDSNSWALDGARKCKWGGDMSPWACSWDVGDVVGLAANIDSGKIAVSKNGSWTDEANGVVFVDEAIKQGVF